MTTATKHTPGKWMILEPVEEELTGTITVVGSFVEGKHAGLSVAKVTGYANASLIAAAPDLLAACKEAFANSCQRSETNREWTIQDQQTHDMLKAEIAAAEGKGRNEMEHTRGAIDAARVIFLLPHLTVDEMAEIIDRQTGARQLLIACDAGLNILEKYCEGHKFTARLMRNAITKAKGKE